MLSSPLGQHLHTNNFKPPAIGEHPTVVSSRHGPKGIVVHKLTQNTRGGLAGKETQIDGAFGMSLACEDATFPCAEGHHMPWPGKVVRR